MTAEAGAQPSAPVPRRLRRWGPLVFALAGFAALDLAFAPLIGIASLDLVPQDDAIRHSAGASYLWTTLALMPIWMSALALSVWPVERWLASSSTARQARLERFARLLPRLPWLMAAAWTIKWPAVTAIQLFRFETTSVWAAILFLTAMAIGPWPLGHALGTWILAPTTRAVSLRADAARTELRVSSRGLRFQLAVYCGCLALASGTYVASLAVSASVQSIPVAALVGSVGIYLSAVLVYAVLCAILLGMHITGPVKRMTAVVESIIDQGDVSHVDRIANERTDEIGKLADASNRMIDRLKQTSAERSAYRESLEELNRSLERRVQERTQELEDNMAELARTQRELVQTARRAGMADVAAGLLHNVGNVLTSMVVSAEVTRELVDSRALSGLAKAMTLLREQPDLPRFFAEDPRASSLVAYLHAATETLDGEHARIRAELQQLGEHTERVKVIVRQHERLAGTGGVIESRSIPELVDEALQVDAPAQLRYDIEVARELDDVTVDVDAHKLMQILINLITNARDAVRARPDDRRIAVRVSSGDDDVAIDVEDNGEGIAAEDLERVFRLGFTTKPDGHGFGLHLSACAAGELGGRLTVTSPGRSRGACFTVTIPRRASSR